jgi:hypothetical protein
MVATYKEYAADHRAQHVTDFDRWCAVLGTYGTLAAVVVAVFRRPKTAAALYGLANVVCITGHIAEGNHRRIMRDTAHHPIWALRADIAVANATIMDSLRSRA